MSEIDLPGSPVPPPDKPKNRSSDQLDLANTLKNPLLGNLDPPELQQLSQSVMQDFQQWKTDRSQLEKTWQNCWEAYLGQLKPLYAESDEMAEFRSQICRPILYESVEAIHAFLMNILLPGDEQFFSVMGKTEADHQNAQVIEMFLKAKLEEMGFYEKFSLFLKQAIITGNSVAAVPWRRKTRRCRINRPIHLLGVPVGREKVEAEIVVQQGPGFEVLDMFDFLIDPNEPDFEKAKVIRKVERPLVDVLRNPAYTNLDGLQGQGQPDEDSHKSAKRAAFGISTSVQKTGGGNRPMVTLHEAWGDFVVAGKVFENYVCVIANGNRVIRFEPNPYDSGLKPFVFTTLIPVPNEVYGLSAIEKSLGLQHAVNTLTNQKLDVINLSINNPFTYLINDEVFDPDTVVTRPGALIPVKSHDTLRPLQYLNNFTVAFTEIADLKEEIQQATGAFKFLTGDAELNAGRTATEVSAVVSGGHQKFSSFTKHLENCALEPTLQLVFEHAKQFMREPETVLMPNGDCGEEFVRILPEILQSSRCRFRITGSEATLLKTQELAALFEFAKLVQADPELRSQIDVIGLYQKIYRRFGFRDEAQLFSPPVNPAQPGEGGLSDGTYPA